MSSRQPSPVEESTKEEENLLVDPIAGLARPVVRVKFGTAGIRGIYGQEVSIRETLAVCFAVHELLGRGRFGLGYDSRTTSSLLAGVTSSAMNWYGSDIEDYGMIPTPVLAFNIKSNRLHAGFSITASHNPPEYAGVKVYGTEGIEFSLEAEHKLEQLVQKSARYTREEFLEFGSTFENGEAVYDYSEALKRAVPGTKKRFRILVDCANGTAGPVTPRVLSDLGHRIVTVNAHPSPSFPGRLPEPMAETLQEVAGLAKSIGVDFAVAHDGDADRLVMIDGEGSVVPDYALSCLVFKIIIEKVKRGTVIISVNSSNALESIALDHGCRVKRSRLGKTFEELYNQRGIYASEPSKMVDPRWGYWEDGIYAAVLIAQYLSETGTSLEEALAEIPKYYNLQKNLQISSPFDYDSVRRQLEERFSGRIREIEEIDGIRVSLEDGSWTMLRSSGTERKARIYAESSTEKEAHFLLDEAVKIANYSPSYKKEKEETSAGISRT